MANMRYEGWWEQEGWGRQPMRNLQLQFQAGSVTGSGADAIGPFTLRGSLQEGRVRLLKQYLDRHSVEYSGHFDGEGVLAGAWHIGLSSGKWLIGLRGPREGAADRAIENLDDVG